MQEAAVSNRKLGFFFFILTCVGLVAYRALLIEFSGVISTTVAISIVYVLAIFASQTFFRVPFAEKYKQTESEYEPTVTVAIPVLNEVDTIEKTVRQVLSSNYPSSKLQVIAINDGSSDGTLQVLQQIKADNFKLINFPQNRGKREALYEAFMQASGQIVVTIDSDTLVEPNCIKEIVKPFIDAPVSAVVGHVEVLNEEQNWLTKMQGAIYYYAFRILKRAESLFNSVICISGCAGAYRVSAVMPILEEWRTQTFLGRPCKDSEDRSLTTFLLRERGHTIYMASAVTRTNVPTGLIKWIKQQIRWKRGCFRESVLAAGFIHGRGTSISFMFYTSTFALVAGPIATIIWLYIVPIFFGLWIVGLYAIGAVLVTFTISTYCKIYRKTFRVFSLLLCSVLNLTIMPFISIYAYLTVRAGKWMTR